MGVFTQIAPALSQYMDIIGRLKGESPGQAAVEGLGATLDPPADVHAPAEYRRHLAEVVVARAIAQANERGGP